MKKFLCLLLLFIGFAIAQAQTVSLPVVLTPGVTYQEDSTDYTLTNTIGRTFKWTMNQHYPTTQDFVVNMDKVSGTLTNVLVTLWGQKSALKNDSTSLGTFNWKGSSADTTGIISVTTENRYRTIYSTFKGTGTGKIKIDVQALKLYWPD